MGLKHEGGLGLVDMENRDLALKAQWVFKMKDKEGIKNLANYQITNPLGETLWEVQLVKSNVKEVFKITNKFWLRVLEAWFDTSFDDPIGSEQVKNQIIWFNSNIRIGNKPIFNRYLFLKSLLGIVDLLGEDDKIINLTRYEEKFDTKDYITYHSIIHAIPKAWMALLDVKSCVEYRNLYSEWIKFSKWANIIYRFRKKDELLLNEYAYILSLKCNDAIDTEELLKFLRNTVKIMIDTKLRSFHMQILLSGVVTNVHLKQYKIKESKSCTFCKNKKETMAHLFFECYYTNKVWKFILETYNTKVESVKQVLCNDIQSNPKLVQNVIVLIGKYYIYKQRCQQKLAVVEQVKIEIEKYQEIECEIARKKTKLANTKTSGKCK